MEKTVDHLEVTRVWCLNRQDQAKRGTEVDSGQSYRSKVAKNNKTAVQSSLVCGSFQPNRCYIPKGSEPSLP